MVHYDERHLYAFSIRKHTNYIVDGQVLKIKNKPSCSLVLAAISLVRDLT